MFKLVIKQEAYNDTLEAYQFYEQEQPGLGEVFLNTLQLCYNALSENPQYYSYISADTKLIFRDIKVGKFPYVVVYEIVANNVIVYAVHNTYRRSSGRY